MTEVDLGKTPQIQLTPEQLEQSQALLDQFGQYHASRDELRKVPSPENEAGLLDFLANRLSVAVERHAEKPRPYDTVNDSVAVAKNAFRLGNETDSDEMRGKFYTLMHDAIAVAAPFGSTELGECGNRTYTDRAEVVANAITVTECNAPLTKSYNNLIDRDLAQAARPYANGYYDSADQPIGSLLSLASTASRIANITDKPKRAKGILRDYVHGSLQTALGWARRCAFHEGEASTYCNVASLAANIVGQTDYSEDALELIQTAERVYGRHRIYMGISQSTDMIDAYLILARRGDFSANHQAEFAYKSITTLQTMAASERRIATSPYNYSDYWIRDEKLKAVRAALLEHGIKAADILTHPSYILDALECAEMGLPRSSAHPDPATAIGFAEKVMTYIDNIDDSDTKDGFISLALRVLDPEVTQLGFMTAVRNPDKSMYRKQVKHLKRQLRQHSKAIRLARSGKRVGGVSLKG